jgi:predicted kinase
MFFEFEGSYQFNASKLGEAHAWCLKKTKEALDSGQSVVVSNTFSRRWEMAAYIKLAEQLHLPIRTIEMQGKWPNVHGVPEEAIARMAARWET